MHQVLQAGAYKKMINQDQNSGKSFPLRQLELILAILSSINPVWDKANKDITKKNPYLKLSDTFFEK